MLLYVEDQACYTSSEQVCGNRTGRIKNDEVPGTAEFCKMINGLSDCTNVRSLTEHQKKRNQSCRQTILIPRR